MINLIKNIYFRFRNLILYAMIGSFCAGLDFCVFTLLVHFNLLPTQWANIISIHVGIFTSFFLNRSFNFRVKNKTAVRFISFYAVGLVGLALSSLLLYLMVDIKGLDQIVSKLISVFIVALTQFVLNKYITFYTKKK